MSWEAISYVTGGFTLIAFVIAVIGSVLLAGIQRQRTSIKKARQEDIPAVLDRIAGRFHIDTTSLSRNQKYELVMQQLKFQADKFRIMLRTGWYFLAALIVLTAFSIWMESKKPDSHESVPAIQMMKGTANAQVELAPQNFNMTATIEATSIAHISKAGWARLQVFVDDEQCNEQYVYEVWSQLTSTYNLAAACSRQILANTKHVFRAVQINKNADAHETILKVSYRR